jgi:hypothetical protein
MGEIKSERPGPAGQQMTIPRIAMKTLHGKINSS